jgi:hypothetical protein
MFASDNARYFWPSDRAPIDGYARAKSIILRPQAQPLRHTMTTLPASIPNCSTRCDGSPRPQMLAAAICRESALQ